MRSWTVLPLLAGTCAAMGRYIVYHDQYHTNLDGLTPEISAGIDHVVLTFAPSKAFTTDPPGSYAVFEDVSTTRKRFGDGTKVMIAIGGWGDTDGFSTGAATEESRKLFAKNVATMLNTTGADGVDIDWEYPGGNGEDWIKNPNANKISEITTYPLLLSEIRTAVGPSKLISAAVPGLERDMIAFTKEQSPAIWKSLNFVNIMTYDLMNRRDTTLKHHTDLNNSLASIDRYIALGLPPAKINLGIAFYAKWFAADPGANCNATAPLGCKTKVLETASGTDTGLSGAMTFDKVSYQAISDRKNVLTGTNSCSTGYGTCAGTTFTDSFARSQAQNASRTDIENGAEYFYDKDGDIFWTWDTSELISRKFDEIVKARGLGGSFAWSLGEDNYDWSRVKAMRDGTKRIFG